MSDEFRRPYMTPAERAAERKRLGTGLGAGFISQPDREGENPKVRIPVWRIEQQFAPNQVAFVRAPSRSGVKIFMHNRHGWLGPFWTRPAEDAELTEAEVLDAVFETVPEFALRMEQEKRSKK